MNELHTLILLDVSTLYFHFDILLLIHSLWYIHIGVSMFHAHTCHNIQGCFHFTTNGSPVVLTLSEPKSAIRGCKVISTHEFGDSVSTLSTRE